MSGPKRWTVPSDGGQSSKWGEWLPLRPARSSQPLWLDLSNLTFVDPLFLVRLRAFLDWHAGRGHEIRVEPPRKLGVRNYLARMGVCDDLPEGCTFDVGQVSAKPHPDVLIPLTRVHDRDGSNALDDAIADLLGAQFTGKLAHPAWAAPRVVGAWTLLARHGGRQTDDAAWLAGRGSRPDAWYLGQARTCNEIAQAVVLPARRGYS